MEVKNTLNEKQEVRVREENPYASSDYSLIVNYYEKGSARQETEEATLVTSYKDVYSTKNFSKRVQDQLNYYPGMHQTAKPESDPSYIEGADMAQEKLDYWDSSMNSPSSFMNAIRDSSKSFDYSDVFGSDASAKTRAENVGKILTECIPCFGRLLDAGELLPDLELLKVLDMNLNGRFDLLSQIKDLFSMPNTYLNICDLLNFLSKQCPSDLLAMSILLTQHLSKINLEIDFNIDFIINLVGPVLSPFLNSMSQWVDKWMQIIVEPMICVVDHLNETIIMAQQIQVPFSEANVDVNFGTNVGADALFSQLQNNLNVNKKAEADGFQASWSEEEFKRLDDVDKRKYNTAPPEWPEEEISLAKEEMKDSFDERRTDADKQKREEEFKLLRIKRDQERKKKLEKQIPNTKPSTVNRDGYYPPEKQTGIKESNFYLDISPLTDSILQLRNILQGSIQYSKDWFTYITQMIYDLLGTDIGWMQKKTGNTFLKSQIVQMLLLIKGILKAHSQNGLECGVNSNFDESQMKFIFENTLNKNSSVDFTILDNGEIKITKKGQSLTKTKEDSTSEENKKEKKINIGEEYNPIKIPQNSAVLQKSTESGIIIKNCLKNISNDQMEEVKSWISEYEKKFR